MFEWVGRIIKGAADWPRREGSYTDPDFIELGDFQTYPAGATQQANRVGVLYAIIKLLVDAVVPLPRAVHRGLVPVIGHPVTELLMQPFAGLDSWLGYEYPVRAMLTRGNGYWMVDRVNGQPVNLVPALEGGASYPGGGRQRTYSLSSIAEGHPGDVRELPASDVVALHWHGFSGLVSPSPVQHAVSQQIRLMRATLRLLEGNVRKADKGGPVLKHQAQDSRSSGPTPDQIRATLGILADSYNTSRGKGVVPALPPGVEGGTVPGLAQGDALALDILRWSVEDIARIYGVSPGRLGQMSGGGAGVRTQRYVDQVSDFAHFAAAPVAKRIDSALTFTLLSVEERALGMRVHTDLTELSMGSPSDLASLGVALVGGGTHTPNEVRQRYHGLPPIAGGDKLSTPRGSSGPGSNQQGGDPDR